MLHIHNGILHSNKKEQTTETFNDKNDSHRYYADSKENRYKLLKTV